MSYMLLVVEPAGQRQTRTDSEGRAAYDSMVRFSETLKSRGLLKLSQSLKTDRHGSRVQVQDGATQVVDGPFAEAKEMIGGIFLLTCKTREQAIAIAGECPAAKWATIEVRELGPCFE
ncbi:MAG TPA: YciI family protein [Steroidobacteraceae bacterium]|nr:YciI family protein [Steroidobacteraceae bacterium]